MRSTVFVSLLLLVLMLGACTNDNKGTLENLPANADPLVIGNLLADRFLVQPHSQYGSPLRAHEPRKQITYPDVCTWLGGLWFAKVTNDKELVQRLEDRFTPLFDQEKHLQPKPNHVDNNVFGALALELYMQTGNEKYRNLGMMYADTQWELPENASEVEKTWSNKGYSWQTRVWLDDMFMITTIQAQAYRVSGNPEYIHRAAEEMLVYMDSIQLDNGLFYHSPKAPFCWGRGNGWMAVGFTELLRILPENHPRRQVIMEGYLKMMKELKTHQSKNGMWRQLVNDETMWEETSSTAMFTYSMITGVKNGWLDEEEFGLTARNAWLALVQYINEKGDVRSVCEGTNIGDNREHYKNRKALSGDLHGQAPVLWCAYALLKD